MNEKNIRASIITPCLNSKKTLGDTIESVLGQTYQNIEYVIVDGGSDDGTQELIRSYERAFGGRLKWISERDRGIYQAMNKGIRLSTGHLIGIINSDDFYERDAVESAVSVMTDEPYQVIYGYLRKIERSGLTKCSSVTHASLPDKMIAHPTCFLTRNIYRKFGLFLERLKVTADYELMLRLYCSGEVTFRLCPKIMADFRTGGVSSSVRTMAEYEFSRLMHGCGNIREFWNAYKEYLMQREWSGISALKREFGL